MENINKHMLKNAMNVGAIAGGSMVGISFLAYLTELGLFRFLDGLQFFFFILAIFIGTRYLRDNILDGTLSYGKALGSGILISIFAGLLLALYGYVLRAHIDPQLFEKEIIILEEAYLNFGFSEDQVEAFMETYRNNVTPISYSIMGTLSYGILGLIISLITSIFLKREPNPFDNITNETNNEPLEENIEQ